MNLKPVLTKPCVHAESPIWHAGRKSFFWIDIAELMLYEYHPVTTAIEEWRLPCRTSLVSPTVDADRVILGTSEGILSFNLSSTQHHKLYEIPGLDKGFLTNDGKADVSGRLWIGTTGPKQEKGAGILYSVDSVTGVKEHVRGLTVPNGITWSANNEVVYHVDSTDRIVRKFGTDVATGTVTEVLKTIKIPEICGYPDGITISDDGKLWIAGWDGFGINCFDAENETLFKKLYVPAPKVTSCAFGGVNRDELIITTARLDMDGEKLDQFPQSGNVFHCQPGISGATGFPCRL